MTTDDQNTPEQSARKPKTVLTEQEAAEYDPYDIDQASDDPTD